MDGELHGARLGLALVRALEELAQLHHRLHGAFAVGALFSHDDRPVVILEGPRHNFRSGGAAPSHQDQEGSPVQDAGIFVRPLDNRTLAVPNLNHGALVDKETGQGDGFVQQASPIFSEIKNDPVHGSLIELFDQEFHILGSGAGGGPIAAGGGIRPADLTVKAGQINDTDSPVPRLFGGNFHRGDLGFGIRLALDPAFQLVPKIGARGSGGFRLDGLDGGRGGLAGFRQIKNGGTCLLGGEFDLVPGDLDFAQLPGGTSDRNHLQANDGVFGATDFFHRIPQLHVDDILKVAFALGDAHDLVPNFEASIEVRRPSRHKFLDNAVPVLVGEHRANAYQGQFDPDGEVFQGRWAHIAGVGVVKTGQCGQIELGDFLVIVILEVFQEAIVAFGHGGERILLLFLFGFGRFRGGLVHELFAEKIEF